MSGKRAIGVKNIAGKHPIAWLADRLGVSIYELGKRAAIDDGNLSKMINGHRHIGIEVTVRLAVLLGKKEQPRFTRAACGYGLCITSTPESGT